MPAQPITAPHTATLVMLTGLAVLSLNMFLPSLPGMAADFQAEYALVALSIAGYLAATAVLTLILGPLSDRYGRRPVMLAALGIFTLASIGCALATDIHVFLAFRVLQGTVIAGWGLSMAIVRDTSTPHEAASRISYISMAMAVAPMLGPIAGGFLEETLGWRANFHLFILAGLAAFAICWFDLGETNHDRAPTLTRQFRDYPDLLRARDFWGFTLCHALSTGSFYCFLAGAPLVAVSMLGLSPGELGIGMGSITIGFAVGSFLSGRLAGRLGLRRMILIGRITGAVGPAFGLVLFLAGEGDMLTFFAASIVVGLGNGMTTPSCNAGTLSVRPKLAGSAGGLSGALNVGLGALFTMLTGVLVTEEGGAVTLLALMLATVLAALGCILMIREPETQKSGTAATSPAD